MSTITAASSKDRMSYINHYAPKLGYSDEQIETFDAVLDSIQEVLETKVRPNIFMWEEEGSHIEEKRAVLPTTMQSVLDELIKSNELYTWFVPEKHGGYGYGNIFQTALTELICQYDMSLHISTLISLAILEALTTTHFRESFLPVIEGFMQGDNLGYVALSEPQAGSELQNVYATSELDGDEYVLNGTKIYISNGGHANVGLFLAKNIVDGKTEGTNVLLVDTMDGITTERLEDKLGIHANPTAQIHFTDVRVPKEYLLAEPGDGYKKVLERLMGMRLGVAGQGLGLATRAYDLANEYAHERVQFNRPIIEFDGVSSKLEAMQAQIPKLRDYVYRGSYALDRYYKGWIPIEVGATGPAAENTASSMFASPIRNGMAHHLVSQAKLYSAEIANLMVYDAQQIFGGAGFINEFEITKIAKDVRILSIYEGTSEIQELIIHRTHDAIKMLPKYKRTSESYSTTTRYENMLFEKFPKIKDYF